MNKIVFLCLLLITGITFTFSASKSVELKVFIAQAERREIYVKYFDLFVAKYKKEKGIDIKINLETPSPGGAANILNAKLASGDAPDVFGMHPINDGPSYNKAGYLEDLSGQSFVKKLFESVKKIVTYDGKVKALPLESVAWGYLYNKEIFDKVGIKPAMTLSEMKVNAEKLKKAGYTPFLAAYNQSWVPQLFTPLITGGLLNSKNPDFIKNMNAGKGSYADLKDFFKVVDLVHSYCNSNGMDLDPDSGSAEFANGNTAMWLQGPWMAEQILKNNSKANFLVAPLPINDDPKSTLLNTAVSNSFAIYSKSKNKEAAFALLNFILGDKEVSSAMYQELKFNPVATIHTYKNFPWVDSAMVYVKQNKTYTDPVLPTQTKDESGRMIQLYYLKQATKDEVIQAMDKAWRNSLKNN